MIHKVFGTVSAFAHVYGFHKNPAGGRQAEKRIIAKALVLVSKVSHCPYFTIAYTKIFSGVACDNLKPFLLPISKKKLKLLTENAKIHVK